MYTIESRIYERYDWTQNGEKKSVYICVPATLVIMESNKTTKSQFIFWN